MNKVVSCFKCHRVVPVCLSVIVSKVFGLNKNERITLSQDYIFSQLKKKYSKGIKQYKSFSSKNDLSIPKNVWLIWFQGLENAPEIIKKCVKTVYDVYADYNITVITKDNLCDYVDIPSNIVNKWERGIISNPHFADIVRFQLLYNYGGVYIDATVYNFSLPPEYLLSQPFFSFYSNYNNQKMVNFFMGSCANNVLIEESLRLIYDYWSEHDYAIDYFITTILFSIVVDKNLNLWNKLTMVHERTAHILKRRLTEKYDEQFAEFVSGQCYAQKLTYKNLPDVDSDTNLGRILEGSFYEKR